ncbi:hypothetical protein ES5_15153, partial [Dietzia cinnamea P4]
MSDGPTGRVDNSVIRDHSGIDSEPSAPGPALVRATPSSLVITVWTRSASTPPTDEISNATAATPSRAMTAP